MISVLELSNQNAPTYFVHDLLSSQQEISAFHFSVTSSRLRTLSTTLTSYRQSVHQQLLPHKVATMVRVIRRIG